jgi:hypothetical protein
MTVDYVVASLPALEFNSPAPLTWEKFEASCGEILPPVLKELETGPWADIETQLRNAMAEARGAGKYARSAKGCSLYWKKRMLECFNEKDVFKKQSLVDKVFWDAAEELVDFCSPLGKGALAAYAIRLRISLRRTSLSRDKGISLFETFKANP